MTLAGYVGGQPVAVGNMFGTITQPRKDLERRDTASKRSGTTGGTSSQMMATLSQNQNVYAGGIDSSARGIVRNSRSMLKKGDVRVINSENSNYNDVSL